MAIGNSNVVLDGDKIAAAKPQRFRRFGIRPFELIDASRDDGAGLIEDLDGDLRAEDRVVRNFLFSHLCRLSVCSKPFTQLSTGTRRGRGRGPAAAVPQ